MQLLQYITRLFFYPTHSDDLEPWYDKNSTIFPQGSNINIYIYPLSPLSHVSVLLLIHMTTISN